MARGVCITSVRSHDRVGCRMGGGHDLHQGLEALITKAGLNMDDFDAPTMSAVLAAQDCSETIRLIMQSLRSQTVKKQVEIVIVAPSEGALVNAGARGLANMERGA